MTRLKLFFLFAKDYLLPGLLITFITWWLVYAKGPGAISGALLLKAGSLVLGVIGLRQYKKQEIFFYRNVGVSEWQLILATVAVDVLLWLGLLTLTVQLMK